MAERDPSLEAKMEQFRRKYAAQLPEKIDRITKLWDYFQGSQGDYEALRKFHQLVHQLAGSAGTYGFTNLGAVALKMQDLLSPVLQAGVLPSSDQLTRIESSLAELKSQTKNLEIASERRKVIEAPLPAGENPVVCILSDDLPDANDLALQIGYFGYQTRIQHPGKFDVELEISRPDVVITAFSDEISESVAGTLLTHIVSKMIPVIAVLQNGGLLEQLTAVRSGVHAILTRPFETSALMERLDVLTARKLQDHFRILAVSSDHALNANLSGALTAGQMEIRLLANPLEILATISEFKPDLALIDLEQDGCNGFELAAVLRQQDRCLNLPIIFIAQELGDGNRLLALHLGGDECISKMFDASDLLALISSRIQRSRLLMNRVIRDGLTGLYNHCYVRDQLEIEIARAIRAHANMCLCLIDLSGLAKINLEHGHAAGDHVLKSLAGMLRQRLRKTDVIGRFSGNVFAVILEGSNPENALRIFQELSDSFEKIRHHGTGSEFAARFCCGIASAEKNKNLHQLISASQNALDKAKKQGAGTVVVS